jgi:sulfonate transport system substrate-binding protein
MSLTANEPLPSGRLSRRTLLKRTALLSLALPLALAACAPIAPAAPADANAGDAPAAEGADPKHIRLIWSDGGIPFIAKERGVFEPTLQEKNITFEWVGPFAGHAPALQAVTGGSADLTFGGSSSVAISAILGGSDFVFTASTFNEPRTTAIIAHPDSGITSVADLVGKTVAANRSGLGEFLLVAALEKYGIPRDQVEIAFLNPADAAPAFIEGKVDAWSIFGSNRDIAEAEYGGIPIFIEGEELTFEEQIDTPSFIAQREYAEANPEVLLAVLEGYQVEAEWATNNPDEAIDLLAEVAGWSPAVLEKQASYQRKYTISFIDDFLVERLQYGADWLLSHEIITEELTIADHVVRLKENA